MAKNDLAYPDEDALRWAAQIVGCELLAPPPAELSSILPPWARVVRMSGGQMRGLHTLWDLRRPRHPHIPLPRGVAHVHIQPNDRVVDLGAYVGSFSIRAARRGAQVTAYEPTPLSAAMLRLTAALIPNITVVEKVVVGTAATKTAVFHVGSETLGLSNSAVRSGAKTTALTVEAIPFATAVRNATVLKIDVEGMEYSYDLPRSIPDACHTLLLGFHPVDGIDWRARALDIIAELANSGFKPKVPVKMSVGASTLLSEGVWVR